jgi:hypothetical protein
MSDEGSPRRGKHAPVKRKKRRPARLTQSPPRIYEIIEREFEKEIVVTENGVSRERTVFEALVLMLESRVAHGSKKALSILRKYEQYALSRPKVVVAELELDDEKAAEVYAEFCKTGVFPEGSLPGRPAKKPFVFDQEYQDLTLEEHNELYAAMIKHGGPRR